MGNSESTQPVNESAANSVEASTDDEPWWHQIEHENLILEQLPAVEVPAITESSLKLQTDCKVEINLVMEADETKLEESSVNVDPEQSIAKKSLGEKTSKTEADLLEGQSTSKFEADLQTGQSTSKLEADLQTGPNTSKIETNLQTGQRTSKIEAVLQTQHIKAETETELSLEEFKEQLASKRLARQTAVQDMREEMASLKRQLLAEQAENRRLRKRQAAEAKQEDAADEAKSESEAKPETEIDSDDENPRSRSRHANIELANAQLSLQLANAENLSLRGEVDVIQRQVGTLKEVICCCKQMLNVKEEQCAQLKMKLQEIENSFSEREMKIMSNNLRQEYERQLVNIRQLRQLYEERQRVAAAEYENLQRLISIKKDELIAEQEKTKSFEERNQLLSKELDTAQEELAKMREECGEHKYEKRVLKEQVNAVNLLFSQLVMGFNGKNNLDIDRLTQMLEENRDLLNEMTQAEGNCSEGAALPKLLFELVEQAAKSEQAKSEEEQANSEEEQVKLKEEQVKLEEQRAKVDEELKDEQTSKLEEEPSMESDKSRTVTPTPAASVENAVEVMAEGEDNTDCVKLEASVRKHRRRSAGGGAGGVAVAVGATAAASLKSHEPEIMGKVATAQEIIGNLPKVWKVLMELLSHHKIERVQFEEQQDSHKTAAGETAATANAATATAATTAATTIATIKAATTTNTTITAGKTPELSVSKTYIKLKDLIMEKKSLVKETNRLKTLNCHLDYRLNEQEKRLSAVSLELTKTWHLVGKMQRQHRQLHTQEQILRYQLQQKRRLLSELKDELEYCRRKWAMARSINDESQELCNDWRREFARRKLEDAHHSAESGYSDSGPPSDEDTTATVAGAAAEAVQDVVSVTASTSSCRRKHLRDQFEHTRKIKRMQSTSPGRQAAAAAAAEQQEESEEIVLRWNSAPPTCGWPANCDYEVEDEPDDDDELTASTSSGAVPKITHSSRSRQRGKDVSADESAAPTDSGTASRIQKLEEQCKSLIQQVLETSGNRERLEVQLCRFQDEISPAQHAVPLDEFINRKRLERMTRASSAPATGSLTPREEEYTRKRSERLGRLEEESRQLLSRIKRTTDRGHYLRKSLDRIRRAPSREGSFESNTEEEAKVETSQLTTQTPLSVEEQAYTSRRAARLQRLEQESQQLLTQLSRNTERVDSMVNKLDTLHEQAQIRETPRETTSSLPRETTPTMASISQSVEQRLEDIERVSANRAERLRRMEEQGNELIARLSNTSERGTAMINRIAEREASKRQEAELVEQTLPTEEEATSNIASTSIVTAEQEEQQAPGAAACCVTVTTTTASQLAMQQSTGAIPKTQTSSQPHAQLCASLRHVDAKKKRTSSKETTEQEKVTDVPLPESLEHMVQRLRALPYPEASTQSEEQQQQSSEEQQQMHEQEQEENENENS